MKKLLISSNLFVSCINTINLTLLSLDNSIQFLDTSSIIIGLELVFLNLCLTVSENLLFLSFKKRILICSFSESRLGFSLVLELGELRLCTGLTVLT